jgi:uncharacterized protein HemY
MMKNVLLLMVVLLVGVLVGLILPAAWRGRLSQPLAAVIGRMVARMPDE